MTGEIFVFGSNLAGRHGKGAALWAKNHHGAIYGQGAGRQGMSYAIPTKDHQLKSLPLTEIKRYVEQFIDYAVAHPHLNFRLTAIGTGLAGYEFDEIAPMFQQAPGNVTLPSVFLSALQQQGLPRCVLSSTRSPILSLRKPLSKSSRNKRLRLRKFMSLKTPSGK